MICDYSEGMCPYLPVALSIRCDACIVKSAYKQGYSKGRKDRTCGEWISKPKRIQVDETDDERIFEMRQEWFCSTCGNSFGFRKPEDDFCKYCGSDNRKRGEAE